MENNPEAPQAPEPAVPQPPAPPNVAFQPNASGPLPKEPKSRTKSVVITLLVIFVLIVGGSAAAFFFDVLPFGGSTPEANVKRMLEKIPEITKAQYKITAGFKSKPREEGAVSWEGASPQLAGAKQAVENDNERFSELALLQTALTNYKDENGVYPPTLSELPVVFLDQSNYLEDPKTLQQYGYRQEAGGANYILHVALETEAAAQQYTKRYQEEHDYAVRLKEGNVIESSKDTKVVYVATASAGSLASPVLFSFNDYYSYLPVEIDISADFVAQFDFDKEETTDAEIVFNVDAAFGDTSFAGSAELRKLAEDFYFKITRVPLFGFFDLAALKDKWVHATPGDLGRSSEEDENKLSKEEEQKILQQYGIVLRLMAENNPIVVKQDLGVEDIDGDATYHYQISYDPVRLADFYTEAVTQLDEQFGEDSILKRDQELLDYLNSDEFIEYSRSFEQYAVTDLWIDKQSFAPRRVSTVTQLVPPADAVKQKDVQYELSGSIDLTNVGEEIVVERPEGAMSYDEAKELLFGTALSESGESTFAPTQEGLGYDPEGSYNPFNETTDKAYSDRLQVNVGRLRTLAEVYYDARGASYSGFEDCVESPSAETCADSSMSVNVDTIVRDSEVAFGSKAMTVNAQDKQFCISHPLPSGETACIDASGSLVIGSFVKCDTSFSCQK